MGLYKFSDEFFDYHEEYVEYYPGSSYGYYDNSISEFVELLSDKLEDVADFNAIDRESRFNFSNFAGTYTWNSSSEKWDKTSHNTIVAKFPFSEGQSNNCEVGISAYTDKSCDIEGETVYLPTKANKCYLAYYKTYIYATPA
jgi:hypothetical protein